MNTDERYSRQRDIVPPERLAACKATVIGVGAIGRQVAQQLAAMGATWLQLVDFDVVEESNIASQGYLEADLGRLKVDATAEFCCRINGNLAIEVLPERFRRSVEIGNVIFCCVDKIDVRRLIWEAVKDRSSFFCDGRMSAEVLRVLTARDAAGREHYPTTLFSAGEAYAGACTAKTTIYCANIAAGMMLAQFTKHLRNLPVDPDIQLNLLTSETPPYLPDPSLSSLSSRPLLLAAISSTGVAGAMLSRDLSLPNTPSSLILRHLRRLPAARLCRRISPPSKSREAKRRALSRWSWRSSRCSSPAGQPSGSSWRRVGGASASTAMMSWSISVIGSGAIFGESGAWKYELTVTEV